MRKKKIICGEKNDKMKEAILEIKLVEIKNYNRDERGYNKPKNLYLVKKTN